MYEIFTLKQTRFYLSNLFAKQHPFLFIFTNAEAYISIAFDQQCVCGDRASIHADSHLLEKHTYRKIKALNKHKQCMHDTTVES
jgi:hypothetical protein